MNKLKILFIVGALYFLFVSFVVKPWEFVSYSLIDDPFVLVETTKYFKECVGGIGCSPFLRQVFETGSGRLRPIYWLLNMVLNIVSGENPMILHVVRYYIVGLIAVLSVALLCLSAGGGIFSAILSSSLLFISPAFTENAARLGTPDLYLVILFSLITLFAFGNIEFKKKNFLIFIFILTAIFIKETAIVVYVPILAIGFMTNFKKSTKWYLVFPLLIVLIYYAGQKFGSLFPPTTLSSFPNYISNYSFNAQYLISSLISNARKILDLTTPVIKLDLLLLIAVFVLGTWKEFLFKKRGLYWFLFAASFFAIMVPWKFVMVRYHLITLFGIYIFTGLIFEHALLTIKKVFKHRMYIYVVLGILAASNIFFKNFALNYPQSLNYINWYKTFLRFENDQIQAISKYSDNKIYINGTTHVDNLEVVYGIPIILKHLYYEKDPKITIFQDFPNGGYVFSRNAFTAAADVSNLPLVGSASYKVDQIDPVAFRQKFLYRPIQSIMYPPLAKSLEYYWDIRKTNE